MPEIDNIQKAVQRVIDQRKGQGEFVGQGHLAKIDKLKSFYEGALNRVEKFEEFRQILLSQEQAQQGPYFAYFRQDPTLIDRVNDATAIETISKIKECIKICDYLHERFSRDTLNISVIGRARQGKSCLLQSISGLTNEVIPAANAGDCTGTTSMIQNVAGKANTVAAIKFYSPEEMVEIVKAYLNKLGLTNPVPNFNSIPLLNTFISESRSSLMRQFSTKQQSLFLHLCKYIKQFDKYSQWVMAGKTEVPEDHIREFVAQYTADNTPVYNYLAVKEVVIYTEFKVPEVGKIVLVDTIGLGDTSLGIEDKMLHTLRENSDAAFLVRYPAAKGDNWRKEDTDLQELIENAMGREMLDKWLYFVINLDDRNENENSAKAMKERINELQLRVANIVEVNCMSPDDVYSKLLLPALNRLSTNLLDIDNNLMKEANNTFTECFTSYLALHNAANNIMINSPAGQGQLQMFGINKWDEMEQELTTALGQLAIEYENNVDFPHFESVKVLEEARDNIYCHVQSQEWYLKELKSMGMHSGPGATYEKGCNITRSKISQEFAKTHFEVLHNLEYLFKWQVADIFFSTGRWSKLPLETCDNEECSEEWLAAFRDEKLKDYPQLSEAIDFILSYHVSMSDMLAKKVADSLKCINPIKPEFKPLDLGVAIEHGFLSNFDAMSDFVFNSMVSVMPEVNQDLNDAIMSVSTIPNFSLSSRMGQIREKIVMDGEAMKELRRFYITNCASLWSEDYRSAAANDNTNHVMVEWINKLPAAARKNFTLSFE